MSVRRTLRSSSLAAAGAITVAVAATLAMPAANGASHSKWIVISTGNVDNTIETPSIAKVGSGYEVVWTAKTGANYAIEGRRLNAAGKPVGGLVTVQSKWHLLGQGPTLFSIGSTRYVVFTGDREHSPSDPYNVGTVDYATSTNGTTWKLGAGSMSHTANAGGEISVANDAGTPIGAWASGAGVAYHLGIDVSHRPATAADATTSSQPGFADDAGVGVDANSHAVWVAFASGNGGAHKDGVWAQQILPHMGSAFHAPGSFAAGGTTSKGVEQNLSVATRAGGGVYTAYITAADRSLDVWKLGAKKPLATIKDLHGPQDVIVTPAPKGRLWVYWDDGNGWHATRSNKAATRFGPTASLAMPKGTSWNLPIAAVGSAGPLQAVALTTTSSSKNEIITRQVLPRLSVSVSPHAVKRGHSFTVRVTDAGDPVKGATVHFNGKKVKTNKLGRASFKVKGSTSLGKHTVTFTMAGYTAASAKITVTH